MGYEIKGKSIYGEIDTVINIKEELDMWINEMGYELEWVEVYERCSWCPDLQKWSLQLVFFYENPFNKAWNGR